MKTKSIIDFVGNTPLVEAQNIFKKEGVTLLLKLEGNNPGGSVKDRAAYNMISEALRRNNIKKGDTLVEATSGNTGIAFSALGALKDHEIHIFMPDWMSNERKWMITKYGATLHEVSKEQGGFIGSIKLADEFAKKIDGFRPQQFTNKYNADAHYETTGPEIIAQLRQHNKVPDALVAGVGTGGTIMGIGRRFKECFPDVKLYPLEPSNSPTLSTGCQVGKHRIQGISDEFIPGLLKLEELDDIIMVDDGDSVIMTQKLATELGIGVGISSGANFLGAVIAQNKLGKDKCVVTLFSDDSKKYLSTDLLKKEPIKEGFLSPSIKLISVTGHCICKKRIDKGACYGEL